jgi:hypothetical protein
MVALMAAVRILQTRTTTAIQANAAKGANAVKAAVISRALQPFTVRRLTSKQAADPQAVARAISDIQLAQRQAGASAQSNPLNAGGVHFRSVSFTATVPKLLTHSMGRPFVGYLLTRWQGSVGPVLFETALPSGLTASQAVNLVLSQTGVGDVLVF